VTIRRGFVDIAGGQVHFRVCGNAAASPNPLVMFHPSPGSSRMLEPLIVAFGASRHVIAPDTLGNGDSAAPTGKRPALDVFVEAHIAVIESLGLTRVDLYGGHTGGNIAAEIAIRRPDLVNRLILDGMSLYADAEREDMLRHYAPAVVPAADGSHLLWIWNFVRDGYLFWPWYRRDAGNRRDIGLPSPDALHDKFVEVVKAARTYHLSYRAAIGYRKEARLPLVAVPTLLVCARNDMLLRYLDGVAALMPRAIRAVTRGVATADDLAETVATMVAFLDAGRPA
jgi:pimeloyl-ACP methyl ester carboxylesterase